MACFDSCGCTCFDGARSGEFDRAVKRELRTGPRLADIVRSHVGWYLDGEEGLATRDVDALGLRGVSGVYILWRQADYCNMHDAEHLMAEYVGKAGRSVPTRLVRHQREKPINGALTTEISLWKCSNRIAKYLEQALLDHFHFPQNRSEMIGSRRLCHHVPPADWN